MGKKGNFGKRGKNRQTLPKFSNHNVFTLEFRTQFINVETNLLNDINIYTRKDGYSKKTIFSQPDTYGTFKPNQLYKALTTVCDTVSI